MIYTAIVLIIVLFVTIILWLKNTNSLLLLFLKEKGFGFVLRVVKTHFLIKIGALRLPGLFISPSHHCNANCVHCYEKYKNKEDISLSTEKIKDIINQFYDLGGYLLFFCSGEFLLRKDALEIINYASNKNLLVSITSNGLLLNEQKIDELKSVGLTSLVVSVDSSDASKHDKLRGVLGCFEKATNGLRLAKEKGLRTEIWTYASKTNINDLENIAGLAKDLNTDFVYIFFLGMAGHYFNKPDEMLSIEEREYLRNKFKKHSKVYITLPKEKSFCAGGRFHINVMPSGDVTFCPPVPYSYGNIHRNLLKECLIDIKKVHKRFHKKKCTGQCIMNFPEFRDENKSRFIYEKDNM